MTFRSNDRSWICFHLLSHVAPFRICSPVSPPFHIISLHFSPLNYKKMLVEYRIITV